MTDFSDSIPVKRSMTVLPNLFRKLTISNLNTVRMTLMTGLSHHINAGL